jgi:pimeloyl-ACP methyl ester carboxylesterase
MSYPWRTSTVESGGETIYFEVTGAPDADEVVVLTHGAGGSHAAWFQQVPVFAAAGYRVVTWDARGFGLSTFETGTHGADAAVHDIAAVLDAETLDRVHLVGQSMGGWWVTAFTVAHPARVQSLTLSNTIGGLWTDALHARFREAVASGPQQPAQAGVHTAVSASFAERDPAGAFLYQQLNTFHTPPMVEVGAALAGSSVTHDELSATGVPLLGITGSDDALFPPKLMTESIEGVRGARVVEIADAGHSPYFERPDEYNAVLLEFLASVPA